MSIQFKALKIFLGVMLLLLATLFLPQGAQATGINGFIGVNVGPVYGNYSYRRVAPVVPLQPVVVPGGVVWGAPCYGPPPVRTYPVRGAASYRINRALSKWNPAYYGHLY